MTITTASLDGIQLADAVPAAQVFAVRRALLGARRDVLVAVAGRRGSWVFPEEPGDRAISLFVHILETTFAARRAAMVALADWADTLSGRVRLILSDEPDRFYSVILTGGLDIEEWLDVGTAQLEFSGDPYAAALATTVEVIQNGAGSFEAADTLVSYPIIEITPTNGTLTGFSITLNGDTLSWTGGSVASGQTITVSSISYTVTTGANTDSNLTGAYDPNSLSMADVTGTFPLIVPDTNDYTFTHSGTASAVTYRITWRRYYR